MVSYLHYRKQARILREVKLYTELFITGKMFHILTDNASNMV